MTGLLDRLAALETSVTACRERGHLQPGFVGDMLALLRIARAAERVVRDNAYAYDCKCEPCAELRSALASLGDTPT